ncbi:MAG: glycosyltransferase family A protein [Nitrospirota bacterium]
MISVIVRTKNEQKWIGRCLAAVSRQAGPDFEVIVVDNCSTDATLDLIKRFDVKLVTISDEEFTFGRSLNVGIRAARGEFIAMISGHCVPATDLWLYRLWRNFQLDPAVVGVYGKQEPLPDTNSLDKRDLLTVFGLERRVQEKDYFFHNANSMVRRSTWEQIPFDEEIAGVEDRDWARRVLDQGHKIVYEPYAAVYHHHGINHSGDSKRADRVVRVIELIHNGRGDLATTGAKAARVAVTGDT